MTSPLLASLAKDLGVNVTNLQTVVKELSEVQGVSQFMVIAACRNNPRLAQSVKATALKIKPG